MGTRKLSDSERTVLTVLSDGVERNGFQIVEDSGGLLSKRSVFVYTARLEKAGLITSREGPDNRRHFRLVPSATH